MVTSIALDHTDWLGHDRESIGREKAGIFRGGKPAVVGEPDMPHSIQQVAEDLNAQLYRRDEAWSFSEQGERWQWEGRYTPDEISLCLTSPWRTRRRHWLRCTIRRWKLTRRRFCRSTAGRFARAFSDRAAEPAVDPGRCPQPSCCGLSGWAIGETPAMAVWFARWWGCCRTKTLPVRWPA